MFGFFLLQYLLPFPIPHFFSCFPKTFLKYSAHFFKISVVPPTSCPYLYRIALCSIGLWPFHFLYSNKIFSPVFCMVTLQNLYLPFYIFFFFFLHILFDSFLYFKYFSLFSIVPIINNHNIHSGFLSL